jgi:hypothetical protein
VVLNGIIVFIVYLSVLNFGSEKPLGRLPNKKNYVADGFRRVVHYRQPINLQRRVTSEHASDPTKTLLTNLGGSSREVLVQSEKAETRCAYW